MATAVLFVLANFQHSWHSGSKLLSALDTNDANNANQSVRSCILNHNSCHGCTLGRLAMSCPYISLLQHTNNLLVDANAIHAGIHASKCAYASRPKAYTPFRSIVADPKGPSSAALRQRWPQGARRSQPDYGCLCPQLDCRRFV